MSSAATHIETNKQLVPALRFKEFDDLWKKSTIEDHFEFKNGLNKEKEFFGYGTPIINFKDVYNLEGIKLNDIKGLVKLSENEIKRYDALKGDVFFTRTSETIFDIGMAAALVEDIPNCVFSGFVLRARPIDNALVDDYKKFCFGTWSVRKEIVTKSSFTTRALTSGTLLNKVAFHFPKSHNEQQKIASFLSAVDKKIEQLTKKKVLLEQYKKGSLQQLFSGQIRFKDENGKPYPDWEETKLVECILRNEKSKIQVNEISGNVKNKENKFPFFTSGEKVFYSDNYLIENENIFMSTGGKATVQFFKGRCSYSTDTFSFSSNSDNSTGFIFYFLENIILKIENQYFYGSGLKHLDKKGIMKYKLLAPSQPEQQKIARYLSSIDTKIESVNNQITQTQTFKKGLLQQLFI